MRERLVGRRKTHLDPQPGGIPWLGRVRPRSVMTTRICAWTGTVGLPFTMREFAQFLDPLICFFDEACQLAGLVVGAGRDLSPELLQLHSDLIGT